jgi:hypothetical protein
MSLPLFGIGSRRLERRQGCQVAETDRIVSLRGLVRVLGKILYWLAVLAVSIALLIALVLFFESRDESQVGNGTLPARHL